MPNYMKKAGMSYGMGGSKKKKTMYGMGGAASAAGSKMKKMYKKGGERYSGTPTSLPGGCKGMRKK